MKIENWKLKIGLLIGLLGYLSIGSIPAKADALSLGVDPPLITIKAIPPTAMTTSFNIQNKGDAEVYLQIKLKPFIAKGENGEIEHLREASEIFKNIQIMDSGMPVENVVLGPQQHKTLTLSINLPKETNISARPPASSLASEVGRDHYFSIVFTSQNDIIPTSNASLNQIGIASNIILSIGATKTPKAILEEFSSNVFYEKGPVPFVVRIRNTGTHFIKPRSEIIVRNMFGQNIGKLNLESVNILTDSVRKIPNIWKENFLLGFYSATLNISLSNEGPTFTRTIHFFAFPFQMLIVIVITLIALIIINNKLKVHLNNNSQ